MSNSNNHLLHSQQQQQHQQHQQQQQLHHHQVPNNAFTVPISNLSAGLKSVHISENPSVNSQNSSQQQLSEQQQQEQQQHQHQEQQIQIQQQQQQQQQQQHQTQQQQHQTQQQQQPQPQQSISDNQSIYATNNNDNGILGHESIQNRYEHELNASMDSESVQRLKSFFQGSNSLSSSVGNHMSISHNSRHNSRSLQNPNSQQQNTQTDKETRLQQQEQQEQQGINTEGYTLISHRSAPNGFKIAIILSELDLPYQTIFLDFNKNEQRTPEFLTINPNGRVPALIDHSDLEQQVSIWESGAIILYLVQKKLKEFGSCSIWSDNLIEQSQILSWLFFQTSGHSPMIGQALHFRYFHPNNVPSAIERYTSEVRRVYSVIEMALAERREALIMELDAENASSYSAGLTPMSQSRYFDYPVWLVGDRITIADLCFVTWNYVVDRIGIDMKNEFPEVYKWTKHMMRRPAVMRALNV